MNPLLESNVLPPFSRITPEIIEPALDQIIADNNEQLANLLKIDNPTWDNFMQPLEDMGDRLGQMWSPVSHLHSVKDSDELREVYNSCREKLTDYYTAISQNEELFNKVKQIADSDQYNSLDQAQQKIIENDLRDFRLSGIALDDEGKKQFAQLSKTLSKLQTKFAENVLDATHAWKKHIADVNDLSGLPELDVAAAKQRAQAQDLDGYLVTLDIPSYLSVMQYANNRELRQEVYTAFVTRASSKGPKAGEFDNTELTFDILKARGDLALLLGFDNYAQYSLATKMAKNTDEVLKFLNDLVDRSYAKGVEDKKELEQFAMRIASTSSNGDVQQGSDSQKHQENRGESKGELREPVGGDLEGLKAWDIAYYSEKLREEKYSISDDLLRPYFPEDKVLSGMFKLVEKLYDIKIAEVSNFDSWEDTVRFFEISDNSGNKRGGFYIDLYARDKKRGGAWMDECRIRRMKNGELQLPVAYLTCNFQAPVGDKPALLTHDEVLTLFHEFGHGLHHMLTQVDYAGVSGINGVAWDAVELPSQFMENWCWQLEVINDISGHYETGEPLPKELFDKMIAAKNFQAAMQMLRQIEFSLFDFEAHLNFDASKGVNQIQDCLDRVRKKVAVMTPPSFNKFQNSFSHVFAGGYDAGYYSYKWAEVLSSDAFAHFEENGLFNPQAGRAFLQCILECGGAEDMHDLFVRFRGREPSIDALLRHQGL